MRSISYKAAEAFTGDVSLHDDQAYDWRRFSDQPFTMEGWELVARVPSKPIFVPHLLVLRSAEDSELLMGFQYGLNSTNARVVRSGSRWHDLSAYRGDVVLESVRSMTTMTYEPAYGG